MIKKYLANALNIQYMLKCVFLIHLVPHILHMVSPQEVPNEWIIKIYNLEDVLKSFKKYFKKNMQLNRHVIAPKLYLIQVM